MSLSSVLSSFLPPPVPSDSASTISSNPASLSAKSFFINDEKTLQTLKNELKNEVQVDAIVTYIKDNDPDKEEGNPNRNEFKVQTYYGRMYKVRPYLWLIVG